MKKNLLWMFAAILIFGLSVITFTACNVNDNAVDVPVDIPVVGDLDLKDPLTIEAVANGDIDLDLDADLPEPIYYSVNGGEKQAVFVAHDDGDKESSTTLTLKAGDKVQLFSRNTTLNDYENNKGFNIYCDMDCYVYGNVMSLISPDDNWKDNKEITEPYALISLFIYSDIINHPVRRLMLPATKISKKCYSHMFEYTKLEVAPELPATVLGEDCYNYMFAYCDYLKTAPALPATQLAKGCYSYMFWSSEGLTKAPALPATKLAESCYEFMFTWCSALAEAPELPATQLANDCYFGMFANCTSLTKAPELPATTLAESCYHNMFILCEKITEAPELPATTMEPSCYHGMFSGTSITKAPVLPATTLAKSCYESMFDDCQALTEAPALPVTQLADRCYAYMFARCSNLTGTIELPAEELPERCYYSMFYRCSKLSSVKCLATTMTGKYALGSWLEIAGTDESVSTRTLTHASGTPWVNSDEYATELTDWFAPTGWTLVSQ